MAEIALVAEPRSAEGTRAARRMRGDGRVPGVLYGHGVDPVALSVDARELRAALTTEAGTNALFELHIGSVSHLAIARELQRHPVRQRISHVDFQVVGRDELVPGDVPIHLLGEALGVTRQGGTIDHLIVSLPVHARPGDMPAAFEIDITDLEFGTTLRVADLSIPDGVTVDLDADAAIVVAHAPRGQAEEGEVEAGAEDAQGAEGPAQPAGDEN